MICIMNHVSRNIDTQIEILNSTEREYKVFTDHTNFARSREKNLRYIGIVTNYLNILSYKSDSKYKIVMHDDIPLSEELFEKIDYIMQYAPDRIVSFFNPTNLLYKSMEESGRHVLQTYKNFWMPCVAFPKSMEEKYIQYAKPFVGHSHYAEDGLVKKYMTENDLSAYVVCPSLVQHEGYDKSIFGTPAKVGKNLRNSATYSPTFDVKAIDWKKEFENPVIDKEKYKE